MIYLIIFISKLLENTLATLRLIVTSNGKKILGAILQFIVTIVWAISAGIVIVDIKDPFKIIVFSLGALIGSYLGSILEQKLALGNTLLICSTEYIDSIKPIFDKQGFKSNIFDNYLITIVSRKKRKDLIKTIKSFDKNAIILSQTIRDLSEN